MLWGIAHGTEKAKKKRKRKKEGKTNNKLGDVLRDESIERTRVTEGRKVSEGVKEVIRLQPEGQDMISDG